MLRKWVLVLIVVVGLLTIGSLFFGRFGCVGCVHQELKSCFDDVQGLKSGAVVRLAGVYVGRVRSVRAQPQSKGCPAEVEMDLATSYALPVPKDALTEIETAGVLGETFVEIDVSQASGPSIENYGYLKSKPTKPRPSLEDLVRGMTERLRGPKATDKLSTDNLPPPADRPKH